MPQGRVRRRDRTKIAFSYASESRRKANPYEIFPHAKAAERKGSGGNFFHLCKPGGRCVRRSARLIFAEDAAVIVLMMQLCACDTVFQRAINSRGRQHANRGREKIDPERTPEMRQERAAERARGIHAHAGEWRFERNERRDTETCE